MLLYSLPVEGKKQKEIFRPFDDTFSEIARVDSLITKWLKSSPLNSDVEVVLEKKSVNGDGTGVGAVWSAWVTVQIPKKHHSHLSKVKKVFEVKAFIPNRQIVLEITVDNNHSPTSTCGECFRFKNKMPPAVLMFTAVDKGKSTEVTAQLNTAYPSMCQLFPKQIVFCPCFWPHLILIAATSLICCPCCHVCAKNISEQDLANQCDRGFLSLLSSPSTSLLSLSSHSPLTSFLSLLFSRLSVDDQHQFLPSGSYGGSRRPLTDSVHQVFELFLQLRVI